MFPRPFFVFVFMDREGRDAWSSHKYACLQIERSGYLSLKFCLVSSEAYRQLTVFRGKPFVDKQFSLL